jgi:hypothetical protein
MGIGGEASGTACRDAVPNGAGNGACRAMTIDD